MSNLWLLGLGAAATYLMRQNAEVDEMKTAVNNTAIPAEPGPETQAIRNVQRRIPDADLNEDINMQDLGAQDVKRIKQERERAAQEVAAYESGPPPIQGVYLHFDNHGV